MQRAETQRTINELGPKLARTFKASSDLLNMRKVEHTLGGLKKYELANEMKVKADCLLQQETAAFNVDV